MTEDGVKNLNEIPERGGKIEEKGNSSGHRMRKPSDRKGLIAVLVVLLVMIVGLIAAIVVVNVMRGDGDGGGEVGESEVVIEEDPGQETVENIQSTISGLTNDEARAYLEDKIAEYTGSEFEFRIRLTELYYLAETGQANCALNASKDIDTASLNPYDLMQYYSAMWTIYKTLGDEVAAAEYYDLHYAIYLEVFNGGGGDVDEGEQNE